MEKPLTKMGITLKATSIYSTNPNGLSERINRELLHNLRALLKEAGTKNVFWGEPVLHETDIHNIIVRPQLTDSTVYAALLRAAPDKPELRTHACSAYVHTHKEKRASKLSGHAEKGEYLEARNGLFRIYKPPSNNVTEAKHVSLYESKFRFNIT